MDCPTGMMLIDFFNKPLQGLTSRYTKLILNIRSNTISSTEPVQSFRIILVNVESKMFELMILLNSDYD